MRKPVFGVSDQVGHKPGWPATENCSRPYNSDLDSICVAKTKVLISCAVTGQLICSFVFTFAKIRFSHITDHSRYIKKRDCAICREHKGADQMLDYHAAH